MSKFRWLRTQIMTKPYMVIRAVRNDGQLFAAWEPDGLHAKEKLRENLDECINDPALPFVANATATEKERLIAMFKGQEGWVEEP